MPGPGTLNFSQDIKRKKANDNEVGKPIVLMRKMAAKTNFS
jgi:hypothetical protein